MTGNIKSGIESGASSLSDAASSAASSVSDAASGAWDAVESGASSAWDQVESGAGSISDFASEHSSTIGGLMLGGMAGGPLGAIGGGLGGAMGGTQGAIGGFLGSQALGAMGTMGAMGGPGAMMGMQGMPGMGGMGGVPGATPGFGSGMPGAGGGGMGMDVLGGSANPMGIGGSMFGGGGGGGPMGGMMNMGGSLLEAGLGYMGAREQQNMAERNMERAANMADPYRQHRGGHAEQLQALEADPSSIRDTPGYQAEREQALDTVDRRMAASGERGSGRRMAALDEASRRMDREFYQQEWQRQAQLSGGLSGQPGAAGQIYQSGFQNALGAHQSRWDAIGYGLGGVIG